MMMLQRVSGKDGFRYWRAGSLRPEHEALDKPALRRVLARVDEQRRSERVQAEYSAADECAWFAEATERLYVEALREEGVEEKDMPVALACVYSVRSKCREDYDEEMQAFMTELIHVKYDLTDRQWESSTMDEKSAEAANTLALHTLKDGTPRLWRDLVGATSSRPLCVLAGSWS